MTMRVASLITLTDPDWYAEGINCLLCQATFKKGDFAYQIFVHDSQEIRYEWCCIQCKTAMEHPILPRILR